MVEMQIKITEIFFWWFWLLLKYFQNWKWKPTHAKQAIFSIYKVALGKRWLGLSLNQNYWCFISVILSGLRFILLSEFYMNESDYQLACYSRLSEWLTDYCFDAVEFAMEWALPEVSFYAVWQWWMTTSATKPQCWAPLPAPLRFIMWCLLVE